MSKIKIVTDSTAYLNEADVEKYNVSVVPLSVHLDDDNFKENEKTNEDFYSLLAVSNGFPTTSQPSMGDFQEKYEEFLKEYDEIISIHISQGISGTIASASAAAKEINSEKITVFDSKSTSVGLEFMVLEAAELAEQGKNMKEIIKRLEYIRDNVKVLFIVNSLEHLRRGGRIGKANALIGTILKVKPILYIYEQVAVFDKVRTEKKAFQRIIEEYETALKETDSIDNVKVKLLSVYADEIVEELRKKILEKYPKLKLEISDVGPVIGSHVGPGTVGIAFYKL